MIPESLSPQETTIPVSAEEVVDHYLDSYCTALDKKYGDFLGPFLRLAGKPVEEFAQVAEVLRSETAGENFCNNLIGAYGVDLKIENPVIEQAKNHHSTSLTYRVAELLGKEIEKVASLPAEEQWQLLEDRAQKYSARANSPTSLE